MNNIIKQKQCQQCKGNGYHQADLKNLGTKTIESHIVPCDNPTCKNGVVNQELTKIYYNSWK
jgi:hypothetical protein